MIEEKIKEVNPDVILTHFEGDISQDHKAVFQSSAVISRPVPGSKLKRVLSYEVPSGTEWGNLFYKSTPFTPNYFVDISEYIEKKIEAMNLYEIELRPKPHPRSIEGIRNLAAYRGQMIGVFFAESFNVHYWKD
jgi:LmbE family N-acetylglucosaminyl deacetylase